MDASVRLSGTSFFNEGSKVCQETQSLLNEINTSLFTWGNLNQLVSLKERVHRLDPNSLLLPLCLFLDAYSGLSFGDNVMAEKIIEILNCDNIYLYPTLSNYLEDKINQFFLSKFSKGLIKQCYQLELLETLKTPIALNFLPCSRLVQRREMFCLENIPLRSIALNCYFYDYVTSSFFSFNKVDKLKNLTLYNVRLLEWDFLCKATKLETITLSTMVDLNFICLFEIKSLKKLDLTIPTITRQLVYLFENLQLEELKLSAKVCTKEMEEQIRNINIKSFSLSML